MSGFCCVIMDSVILSHGEGSCENKWLSLKIWGN
mgnify:CR=1 FL=1